MKRVIADTLWTDNKVVNDFSPEDKYFMLYLLTNPHVTPIGIYQLNIKIAAFELGYSIEAVKVLLDRFANKYEIICFSSKTSEVAIKNYLLHSVIKGGTPVYDALVKYLNEVQDKSLILQVYEHLVDKIDDGRAINITVKNFIDKEMREQAELEKERTKEKDNYEDVNNICVCVCENRGTNRDTNRDNQSTDLNIDKTKTTLNKIKKRKIVKNNYAEFVTLSEDEYKKLVDKYGENGATEMIEILDNYKGANGKKYANDYRAILTWVVERWEKKHQINSIRSYKEQERDDFADFVGDRILRVAENVRKREENV